MSYDLTPENRALIRAERGHTIKISRWYFDSGTYGFWMGDRPLPWGGLDYIGMGAWGSVSESPGGLGDEARGCVITLDATRFAEAVGEDDPMSMIAQMESEPYFNRRVVIEDLHFDPDTCEPAFITPYFSGFIDQVEHDEMPAGPGRASLCTLTIKLEGASILLDRPANRVRTHADHMAIWPGDKFYEFVSSTVSGQLNDYCGRLGPNQQNPPPRHPFNRQNKQFL